MNNLDTGLVIADPYISQILNGEKTWEMRSQLTKKRETIGLIRKGSGQVVGQAKVVDCIGPLSVTELLLNSNKHGISEAQIADGLLDKWNYAWVLEEIEAFEDPIEYSHPSGAVIWVNLAKSSKEPKSIFKTIKNLNQESNVLISMHDEPEVNILVNNTGLQKFPIARDGSSFGKDLKRNGNYTVGEKGNEQKFSSFEVALAYLEKMNTAKWRRPNPKGNWGIVSAIEWK
ncbi:MULTISPECIES: ASCH domain-containing protein [unclassified Shewanella]|uniref:ASCH domain-containing protein n=1 Tax=unclassified Shewanella TaxID=196818 RepID=UPI00354EF1EE